MGFQLCSFCDLNLNDILIVCLRLLEDSEILMQRNALF